MCLNVWHRILAPPAFDVPAHPVNEWMFRALLQSTLVLPNLSTVQCPPYNCLVATDGEQERDDQEGEKLEED